jgi:hypothetical protein
MGLESGKLWLVGVRTDTAATRHNCANIPVIHFPRHNSVNDDWHNFTKRPVMCFPGHDKVNDCIQAMELPCVLGPGINETGTGCLTGMGLIFAITNHKNESGPVT